MAIVEDTEALWVGIEPAAARRLLSAAMELFASVGYHATTTRDIAARAGMSPAAVYVHFRSKSDLLVRVSRIGHRSALRAFEKGLGSSDDPSQRVRAAVSSFAAWHAENQTLARVVQYELENLPGDGRREILAARAHFEDLLHAELVAGVGLGLFHIEDLWGTATAMFSLCIDVARWYSPRSKRSPNEVGALYGNMCLRLVT